MIYTLDPASREVHTMKQCEVEGLCFLATITSIHTGKRNRAVIIRCAYELNYFLHAATDVEVEGVQMLCPPTVTGRDLWSLEELLQIVFFRGVETEESAVVYRTSIGTYKLGNLDLRRKKTQRVWYSEQRLRSYTPQTSNPIWDMSKPVLYASVL